MREKAVQGEYWRRLWEFGIVVGCYFGAARFGLTLAFVHKNVSAVWPPSGVALAALLILGIRVWPAVFLGAALANFSTGLALPTSLMIGVGNTLEAALGYFLLQRSDFNPRQIRIKEMLALIVFGGAVSPIMAASVGVASLRIGGYLPTAHMFAAWWTWWLGDGMGILVGTPFLLAWLRPLPELRTDASPSVAWKAIEAGMLFGALMGVLNFLVSSAQDYAYLVFPFLIWAAMRFGPRGATTAIVAISGLAVFGTLHGVGPFVEPGIAQSVERSLEHLQTFLGVVSLSTLLMAAAMTERECNQRDIELLNERLRRAMAETHHRVKNNLQTVCSLIELQEPDRYEQIPSSSLRWVGQHVRSLAAIHAQLTQDVKTHAQCDCMQLREGLEQLLPLLQEVMGDRKLEYRLQDATITTRQASALALLVNELVNNALKHGQGEIRLMLTVSGETGCLEVWDDGPGFPAGFDLRKQAGMGLELICSLCDSDLSGQLTCTNRPEGGARVQVTFPVLSAPREALISSGGR